MLPPSPRVLYNSDENADLKSVIQKLETAIDLSQFAAMGGGLVTGALSKGGGISSSSQKIVSKGLDLSKNLEPVIKDFQKQIIKTTESLKTFKVLNFSPFDKSLKLVVKSFDSLPPFIQNFIKSFKPILDSVSKIGKNLSQRSYNALDNFARNTPAQTNSIKKSVTVEKEDTLKKAKFYLKQETTVDKKIEDLKTQETQKPNSVKDYNSKITRLEDTKLKVSDNLDVVEKQLKTYDKILNNRNKILELETKILNLSKEANLANTESLKTLNKQLERRLDLESQRIVKLSEETGLASTQKLARNTAVINDFQKTTQQSIQNKSAQLATLKDESATITKTRGQNSQGIVNAKDVTNDTNALKRLEEQQKKITESIEAEQRTLSNLNKVREKASEVTLKNSDDVAKLANELGQSTAKLSALSKGFQAYVKITDGLLTLTSSVKAVIALTEGFQDVTRAIQGTEQALVLMQKQGFDISGFEQLAKVKELLVLNKEVVTDFATTAVAQFNQFNESLNRVGTVFQTGLDLDTRKEELKSFGETIQSLVSNELENTVTETEALSATYEALSGGFTTATSSAKVMEAGLKLAASSGADSGEVMRLLTKTLNAYGKDAGEASKVAAQLNTVVENGITTIDELSGGFGQLGTVANAAGINLEETGASLAVLTTRGTSTAQAMTQLQSLFTTFIDPDFQKKLEGMKIDLEINKATVEADGFLGTMQKLDKALGSSSVKWGQLLPDIQAYRAALTLTSDGLTNLEKVGKKMADTTAKNLQEVFDIRLDDSQVTKFTQVVNKLNSTLINVGRVLAPVLDTGVNSIVKFTDATADWVEGNLGLIKVLTQLTFGIKAVQGVMGALIGTAAKLFGIFMTWRFLTGGLIGDLGALFKVTSTGSQLMTGATGIFEKIGIALGNNVVLANANLTPMQKLGAVFANLTGIGAKTGEQLEGLSGATTKTAEGIKKLNSAFNPRSLKDFGSEVGQGAKNLWQGFGKALGGTISLVENFTKKIGQAAGAMLNFANQPLISSGAGVLVALGAAAVGVGVGFKIIKERTEELRTSLTSAKSNFSELKKSFEELSFGKQELSQLSGSLIKEELSKVSGEFSAKAQTFLAENEKVLQEFDQLKEKRKSLEKTQETQKNNKDTSVAELEKTQEALNTINEEIDKKQKYFTDKLGEDLTLRVSLTNNVAEQLLENERAFLKDMEELEKNYNLSLKSIGKGIADFMRSNFNTDTVKSWSYELEDAFKGAGNWIDSAFGGRLENRISVDKTLKVVDQAQRDLTALNLQNLQISEGTFVTENKIVDGMRQKVDLQTQLNDLYSSGKVISDEQLKQFRESIKVIKEELTTSKKQVEKDIALTEQVITSNSKVLGEGGKYTIENNIKSQNKDWYLNKKEYNPLGASRELILKDSKMWGNKGINRSLDASQLIVGGATTQTVLAGASVGALLGSAILPVGGTLVGGAIGGGLALGAGVLADRSIQSQQDAYNNKGTEFLNSLKDKELEKYIALKSQTEREDFIKSKIGSDYLSTTAARDISSDKVTEALRQTDPTEIENRYLTEVLGKDFEERLTANKLAEQSLEELKRVNKNLTTALKDLEVFDNVANILENRVDLNKPEQSRQAYEKRIEKEFQKVEAVQRGVEFLGNYKKEDGSAVSKEDVITEIQGFKKAQQERESITDRAFITFQQDNQKLLEGLSTEDKRKIFLEGDTKKYNFKNSGTAQSIAKNYKTELSGSVRALEKKDPEAYKAIENSKENPPSASLINITDDISKSLENKEITAQQALQDFDAKVMTNLKDGGAENLTGFLETRVNLIRAATEEIIQIEENHATRLSTLYEGIGADSAKQQEAISKIRLENASKTLASEVDILKGMKENNQYTAIQIKEQEEKIKQIKTEYLVQRMDFVKKQAEAEVQTQKDTSDRLKILISSEFTSNASRIKQIEVAENEIIESKIKGEKEAYNLLVKSGQATEQQKKDHLNLIKNLETEYLVTRLQNIENNLKREYELQQASIEKRKVALDYYESEGLLPEETLQKRNLELQMEGNKAYEKYLNTKLELTKKNGGDTAQLLADIQKNHFESEKLITDSFKVEINKRQKARDEYLQQANQESIYIKERIEDYKYLNEAVLKNFENAKNSSGSALSQLAIEEKSIEFRKSSLNSEFEIKSRIINLDTQSLELQKQNSIENELSKNKIADQIVSQKQLNLEKAQTVEEIKFAQEELDIALNSQRETNLEVEKNVSNINRSIEAQKTKLEIAKATLEIDKEIASIDLNASSLQNELNQYNELTSLLSRIRDLKYQNIEADERQKNRSEALETIQETLDNKSEERRKKIRQLQREIADGEDELSKIQDQNSSKAIQIQEEITKKQKEIGEITRGINKESRDAEEEIYNLQKQAADEEQKNKKIKEQQDRERYLMELESLEVQQTIESRLLELSQQKLDLENKRLEIETQITNNKLEQEKIDLRKLNQNLDTQNNELKNKLKGTTDQKERENIENTIQQNNKSIDLNNSSMEGISAIQKSNMEVTSGLVKNAEETSKATQAIALLQNTVEKAELTIRSVGSNIEEKRQAHASISTAEKQVQTQLGSVSQKKASSQTAQNTTVVVPESSVKSYKNEKGDTVYAGIKNKQPAYKTITADGQTIYYQLEKDVVKNYTDGGAVAESLGIKVLEAMQREGAGAVPIVAKVGEQVLTVEDAKAFRKAQKNGMWEQLKTEIPNYDEGGEVSESSSNYLNYGQKWVLSSSQISKNKAREKTEFFKSQKAKGFSLVNMLSHPQYFREQFKQRRGLPPSTEKRNIEEITPEQKLEQQYQKQIEQINEISSRLKTRINNNLEEEKNKEKPSAFKIENLEKDLQNQDRFLQTRLEIAQKNYEKALKKLTKIPSKIATDSIENNIDQIREISESSSKSLRYGQGMQFSPQYFRKQPKQQRVTISSDEEIQNFSTGGEISQYSGQSPDFYNKQTFKSTLNTPDSPELADAKKEFYNRFKVGGEGITLEEYMNKPGSKPAGSLTTKFLSQDEFFQKKQNKRAEAQQKYSELESLENELKTQLKPLEEKDKSTQAPEERLEILRLKSELLQIEAKKNALKNDVSVSDKDIEKSHRYYIHEQRMVALKESLSFLGGSGSGHLLKKMESEFQADIKNYAEGGEITNSKYTPQGSNYAKGDQNAKEGRWLDILENFENQWDDNIANAGDYSQRMRVEAEYRKAKFELLGNKANILRETVKNLPISEMTADEATKFLTKQITNSILPVMKRRATRSGIGLDTYKAAVRYHSLQNKSANLTRSTGSFNAGKKTIKNYEEGGEVYNFRNGGEVTNSFNISDLKFTKGVSRQHALNESFNYKNTLSSILKTLKNNKPNQSSSLNSRQEFQVPDYLKSENQKSYLNTNQESYLQNNVPNQSTGLDYRQEVQVPDYLKSENQESFLKTNQVKAATRNLKQSPNSLKIEQDINLNSNSKSDSSLEGVMKYIEKRFKEENQKTSKDLENEFKNRIF